MAIKKTKEIEKSGLGGEKFPWYFYALQVFVVLGILADLMILLGNFRIMLYARWMPDGDGMLRAIVGLIYGMGMIKRKKWGWWLGLCDSILGLGSFFMLNANDKQSLWIYLILALQLALIWLIVINRRFYK